MLTAWRTSPTRLREDAATETDLVRGGYRDRVFTELAQNAADAAARAAVPGRIEVWTTGRYVHVANTGAALDATGVQALSALRVSGKPGTVGPPCGAAADTPEGAAVGRFGVGFTAVLTIADELEIRSTTGSVCFSAARTRSELAAQHIAAPVDPAVLRLVWPVAAAPERGDTEVVLRLRPDVDLPALLAGIRAEAAELLLELPALRSIRVADTVTERSDTDLRDGRELVEIGGSAWWQYRTERARWLLPLRAGAPVPAGPDVLRAPTRSDEELSLPALPIARIDLQPDRRRVLPGAALTPLADGYAGFARSLPAADRLVLVPGAGFPRSEVDGVLREAILTQLRTQPWLPVVSGTDAVPTRATAFPGLTADLAEVLADVLPDLVLPELSGAAHVEALARLDVARLGLAGLAESLGGLHRPPAWWRRLYAALEPFVVDRVTAEELGTLPVPLADGRLVTGPRTTLLFADVAAAGVSWARLAHPDAVHPLLARLGAGEAAARDLLSDPALRALLDAGEPLDPETLAAVLRLAGGIPDPGALPGWIGLLPLPSTDGETRPADELLLPGAPLAGVVVDDAPFGTVDPALVERVGVPALRAAGVGWGFTVLREPDPVGPDPDLDDSRRWWDGLAEDPPVLVAVRDLDLVAERAWPAALTLLAGDPATRPLLSDPDGYTGWWLRRHARLDGVPLGLLRHRDDPAFAGLLDACAHPQAGAFAALLAHPDRIGRELAQALVDALGDPDRSPAAGTIADVHHRLGAAVQAGRLDVAAVRLPVSVRAMSGVLAAPDTAMVLDRTWLAPAVPADRLVVGGLDTATGLAALLDLPLASAVVRGRIEGAGRRSDWTAEPAAVLARLVSGIDGAGELVVHDELIVRLSGAVSGPVAVPWWVDDDGVTHLRDGLRR